MNVEKLIEALGGAQEVIKITGMSAGRISQMKTRNKMPKSWIMFFENKYPEAFNKAQGQNEEEKKIKTLVYLKNKLLIVGDAIIDNFFTKLENAKEVIQIDAPICEEIERVINNTAELVEIKGALRIPNQSIDFSIDL
jgi:hypothetical protein